MNWTITGLNIVDYVRVTLSGMFCLASARSVSSEIVDEPFWDNGTALLIDITNLQMSEMNASDIECLTRMIEPLNQKISKSRIAIVCSSDIQFGFSRQFQIKAEEHTGADIRVFRSETDAIKWLTIVVSLHDKLLASSAPLFGDAFLSSRVHISYGPLL